MTTPLPYASQGALKTRLDLQADSPALDAILDDVLAAASRQIDRMCNRHFYATTAIARTYTAEWGDCLPVHDLVSVTALLTDGDGDRVYETTWLTSDYDLTPDNAAADGQPYTAVRLSPRSTKWFPTGRRGVQITGVWGWPAVPEEVGQACLLLAHRSVKRADTPLGVVQAIPDAPATNIRATDPDVAGLLAPYRRLSLRGV